MSIHTNPVRTVGSAVLAGLLTACTMAGSGATGRHWTSQQAPVAQAPQAMAQAEQPKGIDRLQAIIDQLNLSQDQVAKIHGLIQQRPQADEGAIQARVDQLKQILSQPVVDANALATHIEHDRQQIHKKVTDMIGVIAGIRDILTPDQRAMLAKMPPPPEPEAPSDLAADLGLNDQQKAALNALKPMAADNSLRQAIREFMVSGDMKALQDTIDAAVEKLPSAATVASALASLSTEQRQKLIDIAAERIEARKEAAGLPQAK